MYQVLFRHSRPTQRCSGVGISPQVKQPKPAPRGQVGGHSRAPPTERWCCAASAFCAASLSFPLGHLPSSRPSSMSFLRLPSLQSLPPPSWLPVLGSFYYLSSILLWVSSSLLHPLRSSSPGSVCAGSIPPDLLCLPWTAKILFLYYRRSATDPLWRTD